MIAMLDILLFLLATLMLIGAPAAVYFGWKGRLGWALLLMAALMAVSIASYTFMDWHGREGSGEAMIGTWVYGMVGMGVAFVAGAVAFLLSMGAQTDDFE